MKKHKVCCFLGWPFPVEELEAILPSSLTRDVGGNVQREPVILKDSWVVVRALGCELVHQI